MSKKTRIVPTVVIAALYLVLAMPVMAGDQEKVSWGDAIVEFVGEVIDALLPESPEDSAGEDNLPGILPIIEPDG